MIKKNNGFTMLDIMITLSILLVFTLIAIPRLTSYYTVKLFGVANKLASDIQYAQQLAISKQIRCGISFNPVTESYFVYENTVATRAKDPCTRGDMIVSYQTEGAYTGVNLLNTNFGNRVEFDSLGRPYNFWGNAFVFTGVVNLQSQGESMAVLIAPNTGAIRVQ